MGSIIESCAKAADKVRDICPLVHCITNYVTVNDVANCILAIGASPIMADDIAEAADITSISKALVINMGTLNARTVESMVAAGKKANELGVPVVLTRLEQAHQISEMKLQSVYLKCEDKHTQRKSF